MSSRSRARLAEILGLLLLFLGLLGIASMQALVEGRLGGAPWDRVTVGALRSPFGAAELETIERNLPGRVAAAATAGATSSVSAGSRTASARVVGVSPTYAQFVGYAMVQGGFFTEQAARAGDAVAVIASDLAWSLFATMRAAATEIRIGGKPYRVVGVYEQPGSLLDAMVDDGFPRIYVPIDSLPREERGVASISGAGVSREEVERALQSAGRQPGEAAFGEFDRSGESADQKRAVLVLVAAVIGGAALVRLAAARVRESVAVVRGEMRDHWLRQAIRRSAGHLAGTAAVLAGTGAALVLLWLLCRLKLFIPAEYVPDRLIDLGYYVDLAKRLVREANALQGFVPPLDCQLARAAARVQTGLMAAGLAGVVLVARAALPIGPGGQGLAALGAEVLAAVVAAALLSSAAGLPPVVDVRDLAVLWFFSLMAALRGAGTVRMEEAEHGSENESRGSAGGGGRAACGSR